MKKNEVTPVHVDILDWSKVPGKVYWCVVAYETLDPPWYRQNLPVCAGIPVVSTIDSGTKHNIRRYHNALYADLDSKTAHVFHNVQWIPVDFQEAMNTLDKIEKMDDSEKYDPKKE